MTTVCPLNKRDMVDVVEKKMLHGGIHGDSKQRLYGEEVTETREIEAVADVISLRKHVSDLQLSLKQIFCTHAGGVINGVKLNSDSALRRYTMYKIETAVYLRRTRLVCGRSPRNPTKRKRGK